MEQEAERGAFEIEDPKMGKTESQKGINVKLIIIIFAILIVAVAVIILLYFLLSGSSSNEENDPVWGKSYKEAKEFVSKLTLQEKLSLLYGTENLGGRDKCVGQLDSFSNGKVTFPGMCLQDGPAGVRQAEGTSVSWQSSLNTACTFNKELMYQIGKSQGEENKAKGINTFLSPSVNIMRTPQSGRIWEAYGEDPFYNGVCATQIVKGIQDAGVIATIKHYVCNDQETYREYSSSNVETQALFDIYVEPFYRPIKEANVAAMMCAYNAVNDTYSCENSFLLTDVLRGFLNFKGFVMSDWWALKNNSPKSFNAGCEVNMPGGSKSGDQYVGRDKSYWSDFETYVKDGKIKESRVDEAATRILAAMYQLNQMENYPKTDLLKNTTTKERIALHRKAATESQVLLRNDGILPISVNVKSIGVIGNDAFERDCLNGDWDKQCTNKTNEVSNGHIPLGYGSGTTDFNYLVTPVEAIMEIAQKRNIDFSATGGLKYQVEKRKDEGGEEYDVYVSAEENIEEAVELAKQVEVAIVFVKADSGEFYLKVETSRGDRKDLDLWHNGNELIEKVADANENTIVVINAPAVVNVPWLDKVKAVVFSGFPGMESGNAIADILFGEKNPSGHLPYAWGKLDDYGIDIIKIAPKNEEAPKEGGLAQYNYNEGLYVGQRMFNKKGKKPIFPFGWGLSYSKFIYNNLKLSMSKEGLKAKFEITNNSTMTGSAVPMMFITFPSDIGDYPKHIFKGFDKVEIKGEAKVEVEILADDHALSYYNVDKKNWVRVDTGKIHVAIAENGDPDQALLEDDIDAKY